MKHEEFIVWTFGYTILYLVLLNWVVTTAYAIGFVTFIYVFMVCVLFDDTEERVEQHKRRRQEEDRYWKHQELLGNPRPPQDLMP